MQSSGVLVGGNLRWDKPGNRLPGIAVMARAKG
jgi:hypothetical protein